MLSLRVTQVCLDNDVEVSSLETRRRVHVSISRWESQREKIIAIEGRLRIYIALKGESSA